MGHVFLLLLFSFVDMNYNCKPGDILFEIFIDIAVEVYSSTININWFFIVRKNFTITAAR